MRNLKRMGAILMALALVLSLNLTAFAAVEDTGFSDVAADAWYADAVLWASQRGVISGYGNNLFGTNDPVTREQIATILWRYAGSPSADAGQDFADESEIASYAAAAVDWARANGVVSGVDGNRFLPGSNATRAQVSAILHRFCNGVVK